MPETTRIYVSITWNKIHGVLMFLPGLYSLSSLNLSH